MPSSNGGPEERRHLPFDGVHNFRDLGGYETKDGRRVRWNRLYRSASLASLTDEDQVALAELDIALVCDLRRDEEREDAPSRIGATEVSEIHTFNIGPNREISDLYRHLGSDSATVGDVRAAMLNLYRSFVTDYRQEYSRLLRFMLEHERLPLLFHCAAGKDRTGFAAAVTLGAVGVPRELIFEDYLLTNELLRLAPDPDLSPELFHVAVAADPEYLASSFDQIDEDFGGIDRYLRDGLDLSEEDRERLQGNLLE